VNDLITNEHAGWFRDVRAVLAVTEGSLGLPLPSIGSTLAAFHYTGITHAEDAREAVALAETLLAYALNTEFNPRPVPQVGSSAHYVLSAYLPSGLRVDIVARAGIFDGQDERVKALAA
jgi:ABC-type anion transport system duplicated permease subunit